MVFEIYTYKYIGLMGRDAQKEGFTRIQDQYKKKAEVMKMFLCGKAKVLEDHCWLIRGKRFEMNQKPTDSQYEI